MDYKIKLKCYLLVLNWRSKISFKEQKHFFFSSCFEAVRKAVIRYKFLELDPASNQYTIEALILRTRYLVY